MPCGGNALDGSRVGFPAASKAHPSATVAETLAKPIAQELLFSDIPARLSYIGLDGDPRVVPVGSGGPA